MRSCSLLAPWGGVILLKRPVRRRGVGTNNFFCACERLSQKLANRHLQLFNDKYIDTGWGGGGDGENKYVQ